MNGNPYAPPKAAVADPTTQATPPHAVALATRLQWVAVALGAVNLVVVLVPVASVGQLPFILPIPLALLGTLAVFAHNISRGRNWARIAFLVMFGFGLPGFLLGLPGMLRESASATAISVLMSVLQTIALFLVFTGAGARWFRGGNSSSDAGT